MNKPVIRDLHDVADDVLEDIEHFFRAYNEAQGRQFSISGRAGAAAAEKVLSRALRPSSKKKKK